MVTEDSIRAPYQLLRIFAFAGLIGAPLIYLYLVHTLLKGGTIHVQPNNLILYGGLAFAAAMGGMVPIMKRSVMTTYRRNPSKFESVTKAAQSIGIIQIAPVEACYVFGVAVFYLTGLANGLPYFYSFGIIYSIIYWPTESRFRNLVGQLEAK